MESRFNINFLDGNIDLFFEYCVRIMVVKFLLKVFIFSMFFLFFLFIDYWMIECNDDFV